MLLIIEALLLISAAVGQDHRHAAEGQIYPLNMSEYSVDDQFYSWFYRCTKKMEHRVQTEFLEKEMSDSEFGVAWKAEAIQILKKTQTKCYNTYRGTKVEFDKTVKGKEVRFGQFASSSLDRSIAANKFGNKSCFEIYTCYGADVTKYSRFHEEKEVLIPPYETFTVSDVKQRSDHADLWCGTVYILKSYTTRSFLNCAVANSGNQVAFLNVLLILIIFCSVVSY
ncbi:hypothetical protein PO909_000739 [Leuciscus waleckii]